MKAKKNKKSSSLNDLLKTKKIYDKTVKKLIVEDRRLDILAHELGYFFDPFHELLWEHHEAQQNVLDLCPRSWGKTTVGTILSVVLEILHNQDVRILLASETVSQAQTFLKEVKAILKTERIIELFGDLEGDVWHESSINVSGQTSTRKERTIMTTGVDGAITGYHFEIIYADDLVSLKNARTETRRETVKNWFKTTLLPCVIDEHSHMRLRGTRYHPDDLYEELMTLSPKFKNSTMIIPALDPDTGESNNPTTFSTKFLQAQREDMGEGAFKSQYLMDPTALAGDIFDDSDFRYVNNLPAGVKFFQGVDLAIGEKARNDEFAIVIIAVDPRTRYIYVVDYYHGKIPLETQNEQILRLYEKYDVLLSGIESNAFQMAKIKDLRENPKYEHIKTLPIFTDTDKITRAQIMQVLFGKGEVYFLKQHKDSYLTEQILSMPDGKYDDLFDALDMAITAAFKKKKKRNKNRNIGVISPTR